MTNLKKPVKKCKYCEPEPNKMIEVDDVNSPHPKCVHCGKEVFQRPIEIEPIKIGSHDIGISTFDYFVADKINELIENQNLIIKELKK